MNNYLRRLDFVLLPALIALNPALGQWRESTINGGVAIVEAFCVKNDTIYAGTDAGLYVSTDSGAHWKQLGFIGTACSIVINGTNIFVGPSAASSGLTGNGEGVYLSTDSGSTWNLVINGLTNLDAVTLAVHAQKLFAGTPNVHCLYCLDEPGGVYVTSDNGTSWSSTGLIGLDVNTLLVNGASIYAGTSNGVCISTNDGVSWDSSNADLKGISIYSLAASSSELIAGSMNEVYLSTDGGSNWSKIATFSPNANIHSILIDAGNLYIVSDAGVYLSRNNGSTWSSLQTGLPTQGANTIVLKDSTLYLGTSGRGVFTSTDEGATWSLRSAGLTRISGTNAFADLGDKIIAGTSGTGIFLSTNEGITWYSADQSPSWITSFALDGTHLIAGSPGGLFLSEDSCRTWTDAYSGPWLYADTYSKALGAVDRSLYASFNYDLFISTDGGLSWNPSYLGKRTIAFVARGSDLFAGTFNGLYLSTDNGITWGAMNNGISDLYGLEINALATNDGDIYLGAWGVGMYISTDNGSSWNEINAGLTNLLVQSLAVSGSNVFVGTSGGGIFHSPNNGSTWEPVNNGLRLNDITSLFIKGSNICAGSSGDIYGDSPGGIFWRPLSEVTNVEREDLQEPDKYSLSQNYPNPFNPTTTITYQLPSVGHVTLKVYDVLGREVKSLVNERQTAGSHSVAFDGSNLSSGVYLYRLQAGSYTETKKLVLLK